MGDSHFPTQIKAKELINFSDEDQSRKIFFLIEGKVYRIYKRLGQMKLEKHLPTLSDVIRWGRIFMVNLLFGKGFNH